MMSWGDEPERTDGASRPSRERDLIRVVLMWIICGLVLMVAAAGVSGQDARINDLTVRAGDIPFRLVGYGLVTGLDGSGDRVVGSFSAGHTVRSVANLLRRFNVEVPENMLRTRNVAAVVVTAEISAYLRPGGRFDVHVSSLGDATSLRGRGCWDACRGARAVARPAGGASPRGGHRLARGAHRSGPNRSSR